MVLLPAASRLPGTLNDAVAAPPDPLRLALPSVVPPTVNATDPMGEMLPLAALTVTVSEVLPLDVMLVELAVTVVVVAVVGTATLTVTNPEEALKPLLPP